MVHVVLLPLGYDWTLRSACIFESEWFWPLLEPVYQLKGLARIKTKMEIILDLGS